MTRRITRTFGRTAGAALLAAMLASGLAGCANESFTQGYLLDEQALASVKPGTDAQQVLQIMGTPSTVSTVGNQTWYYISERMEVKLQFMGPRLVDRRVVAINFTKNLKVEKIANYGLQDGVVFDFVSRKTPTSGNELTMIRQLLRSTGQIAGY
jgi:outer membrane protein assembly factor BamE (lipoprotein component of BamABCDE complex)